MKCIYCNHIVIYTLSTGQKKCAKCKKKFSPLKLNVDKLLIKHFCGNGNALLTSKILKLNYITVKNRFDLFRKLIVNFLEKQYEGKNIVQYDEYIYLPKSKKKDKKNIFEAQNFLTFNYEDKVYNLLMPNLNRFKNQFLQGEPDEDYFSEFKKFINYNKIAKTKKMDNIILKFWRFFEDYITLYKGVKNENFIYYLKESEFRFNYEEKSRIEILSNLYFDYIKQSALVV